MWTWHDDQWRRSLVRTTREFRSAVAGSVILRYDPALDPLETALFRLACNQQAAAIERLLGARLRHWRLYPPRLRVYVFRSADEVSRVYGGPVGGFASWTHWYIVVNLEADWDEILRHELAHIIGGRWNPNAPTVLCEGLAVWAQRTVNGCSVDHYPRLAFSDMVGASELLLGPSPALGSPERHRYYALAGSFTGALIKRFGFARYRSLYGDRAVTGATFAARFPRHFGSPLSSVLQNWLDDLSSHPAQANFLRRGSLC